MQKTIAHTKLVVMLSTVGDRMPGTQLAWNSQRELVLAKAAADRNSSVRVLSPGGRAVGLAVL